MYGVRYRSVKGDVRVNGTCPVQAKRMQHLGSNLCNSWNRNVKGR